MSRVPPVKPEELTPEQRRVYDAIAGGPRGRVRGPFTVLLHSPELADRVQALGEFVRFRSSLPARLSELAILATARAWTCQYEWLAHAPIAEKAGVAATTVAAIREGRRPDFASGDEAAVYDYAVALHRGRAVNASTYDAALRALGAPGLVELTALIGYYALLAMTLNAHQVPLPEGAAPPLPPLGERED
ncbi:MAG: carboxymuconolactone decarboxylase family protein [Proteobacteria bacterium]|nr:carboxymuconolactone decarboxylase family protein [Pseudomonadota bacterium]